MLLPHTEKHASILNWSEESSLVGIDRVEIETLLVLFYCSVSVFD
jgi:hypothetical protein